MYAASGLLSLVTELTGSYSSYLEEFSVRCIYIIEDSELYLADMFLFWIFVFYSFSYEILYPNLLCFSHSFS